MGTGHHHDARGHRPLPVQRRAGVRGARTHAPPMGGPVRLATIRTGGGTRAVRVDSDVAVETGHRDLGALLREADWHEQAATANGPAHPVADLDFAPLITQPDKIICVGLNYRQHILEMGRELPEHPTLFAKYTCALVGANDPV